VTTSRRRRAAGPRVLTPYRLVRLLIVGAIALGAAWHALRSAEPRPPATPRAQTIAQPVDTAAPVVVKRVIDGDTIQLVDGRRVRYIGIDAPETRRRQGNAWVEDPEPYAKEATDANRRLVEGNAVTLEYDVQRQDRFGRDLAYVYVDGRMVNAVLAEEGYVQLLTVPPNVRHAEQFRDLIRQARQADRGLWGARDASRAKKLKPTTTGPE